MKLLIAEDSAPFRKRLLQMLSQIDGVEIVGAAADGTEALAAARTLLPDVAILDIQMPCGSGIDVLRLIKGEQPNTVVIMLTGHSEDQYTKICFKLGADHFLSKGDGSSRLIEIITELTRAETLESR